MIKYVATITIGDSYHKAGESYFISESEIDKIREKGGLRIYESSCGPDGAQIYYPCKITAREYSLVSEREIADISKGKVITDFCESDYDWQDHWC